MLVDDLNGDAVETKSLFKDLLNSSSLLTRQEARYVVDLYYQLQEYRKRSANQVRIQSDDGEPTELLTWLLVNFKGMEGNIKTYLDKFSDTYAVGRWAKSICGIGPVISAGLIAHIDIEKAPYAGHIWSFAGISGKEEWKKGEKRPWNAQLKTLCWKIGQSFVKVSNNKKDVYGKLWRERKNFEIAKNEKLEYADQAEAKLKKFKIGKTTDAYKFYIVGQLPPAHIEQRAERYATKMFLSHWQQVAYFEHYKEMPPKPFVIAELAHAHLKEVPNWPF